MTDEKNKFVRPKNKADRETLRKEQENKWLEDTLNAITAFVCANKDSVYELKVESISEERLSALEQRLKEEEYDVEQDSILECTHANCKGCCNGCNCGASGYDSDPCQCGDDNAYCPHKGECGRTSSLFHDDDCFVKIWKIK